VSITIGDTTATDVGHALELLKNNSGTPNALTGIGIATFMPVFSGANVLDTTNILYNKIARTLTFGTVASPLATVMNTTLTVNGTAGATFRVGSDNFIRYGYNANAPRFFTTSGAISTPVANGGCLELNTPIEAYTGYAFAFSNFRSSTTGTAALAMFNAAFSPTSGSAIHRGISITGVITQTGGANGATRGLHIGQTLTSAANYAAAEFAISSNTGFGIIQSGSAGKNVLESPLNVGTVTPPAASAMLELTSTNKGFLPTRMTGAQAESITFPAEGLMVYATDGSGVTITTKGWWGFDGATWVKFN
jgi:hypothetical protein